MSNRDISGKEAETIIAASVRVEGDFASQGNVLIEGTVNGSLRTERNLRVGERATINADVVAANASVAGEIKGNITVSEKLELEPTARISGDIRTKSLVVANGAVIEGRISMGETGSKSDSAKIKAMKTVKSDRSESSNEVTAEMEEKQDEKAVSALFGR